MHVLTNQLARLIQLIRRPSVFVRNVGSTVVVQVLSLILSLGSAAIIARLLGTEGKGVLQLALMIPAMLSLFLSGGIGVANTHFIGSGHFDVPALTANALTFTLTASAIGFILVAILLAVDGLTNVIPGVPVGLLLLALIGLPIGLLSGYYSTILQGLQEITTVNHIKLFVAFSNLVFLIFFVSLLSLGLPGAIYASVLSSLLSVTILGYNLAKHGAIFRPRWDRKVMRETLQFGLRGYFGNVLQFFNYRLDVFIVNYFLGPASVGIYGVAAKLAELVWYFPNAVSFVIFPKAAASAKDEMNRFTPRAFRVTLLFSLLAGIGLAIVGQPLIKFIYTDEFIDAFFPMIVLLPGVVLLGGARVLTSDIAGRGYPEYNSINSAVALIVTIALDLALIPKLGILGASIASSAAYTLTFLLSLIFYRYISTQS